MVPSIKRLGNLPSNQSRVTTTRRERLHGGAEGGLMCSPKSLAISLPCEGSSHQDVFAAVDALVDLRADGYSTLVAIAECAKLSQVLKQSREPIAAYAAARPDVISCSSQR